MKCSFLGIVPILAFCGCSDPAGSPSEVAISLSNHLTNRLSSNASVRVILETKNVRSNLTYVVDARRRRDMINEWKKSLYNIPVQSLRPSDRYASVREAYRVVSWDVVGALWDIDKSYEGMWEVYLEALAWLSDQSVKMKPEMPQKGFDVRQEMEKWNYYQALVEYRESVIENLELNGFDERIYNVDPVRMDVIRKRFEKAIGRSVRPRGEIKLLGRYVKEARTRIAKERGAALGSGKKKEP